MQDKRGAKALRTRRPAARRVGLAICDYAHVVVQRSSIAIASALNSLDGVPLEALLMDMRTIFAQSISEAFGLNVQFALIKVSYLSMHNRNLKKRTNCLCLSKLVNG